MQYLQVNGQKIGILTEINLGADKGRIVQLSSGAWAHGVSIPPQYIKSLDELEGKDVPQAIKDRIADWLNKSAQAPQPTHSQPTIQPEWNPENPFDRLSKALGNLGPEAQWGLVNTVEEFVKKFADSHLQGPEVNSHEGYGQGMDVPVYQERHPVTGGLAYKHPDGPADIENALYLDDPEQAREAKAYLKNLSRGDEEPEDLEAEVANMKR